MDTVVETSEIVSNEQKYVITQCSITIECPDGQIIVMQAIACSETLSTIKLTLAEYLETCHMSCFNFALNVPQPEGSYKEMNEFMEVGSALKEYLDLTTSSDSSQHYSKSETVELELHLKIVSDTYNVKKARLHVRRTRELLTNPPSSFAGVAVLPPAVETSQPSTSFDPIDPSTTVIPAPTSTPDVSVKTPVLVDYPTSESVLSTADPLLGRFYDEALLRAAAPASTIAVSIPTIATSAESVLTTLSKFAAGLTLSDWNPPPTTRQMQGDLAYIQVAVPEGVFQVTACANGFFVNRTSGNHFDPRPAAHHHFAPTLLELIQILSTTLRSAWRTHLADAYRRRTLEAQEYTAPRNTAPLEQISMHFKAGRGDQVAPPQWCVYPQQMNGPHNKDVWRAHDDLCDSFGLGEDGRGPSREWNDEYQAVRALPAESFQDRLSKAKLLHRTMTEFVDSARAAAAAIINGLITPMNPMDPVESQVVVYNNIFFSRSVDAKESFKLCYGDAACRKVAGHDIKNQRFLQSLGIAGVSSVLSTVIDYLGHRLLAQSVIPGVLSGAGGARLVYGVMEFNKRLSCKQAPLQAMQRLGQRLRMPLRRLHSVPLRVSADYASSNSTPVTGDSSDNISIRLDDVDEVVGPTENSVPHVGPVEGKMLQGSDGRIYALELVRLSPRDANYVPGCPPEAQGDADRDEPPLPPRGVGTGCMTKVALAMIDPALAVTYVLRHELVNLYIQRLLTLMRQKIYTEAVAREQAIVESAKLVNTEEGHADAFKRSEADGCAITAPNSDENQPESHPKDVPKDHHVQQGVHFSHEQIARLQELELQLSEMTSDAVQFEFSPNAFIPNPEYLSGSVTSPGGKWLDSDVDEAVILRDEAHIRQICKFLYCHILPELTKEVLQGEVTVLGGEQLVDTLHSRGINLRYLGRLAELAVAEETEDTAMGLHGKQRAHVFPQYWLDLLEIEMIARAARKVLETHLLRDRRAGAAPGQTVASVLSHLLGGASVDPAGTESGSPDTAAANAPPQQAHVGDSNDIDKLKKKKKGKGKGPLQQTGGSPPAGSLDFIPVADALPCKASFLQHLVKSVEVQFTYKLTLGKIPSDNQDMAATAFLDGRLPRLTLLRRICILGGIRIATRDYDFTSSTPFSADDIYSIVPRVKPSTGADPRPDQPCMPEVAAILASARRRVQVGQFQAAFEMINEASALVHECVGPVHREYRATVDEITALCLSANEFEQALPTATRNLALSVQIDGLDSAETINQHLRLASVHMGMAGQVRAMLAKSVHTTPTESVLNGAVDAELCNATPKDTTAAKEETVAVANRLATEDVLLECKRAVLNHLQAARYLVEVIGGPRHPELLRIFLKLGSFLVDDDAHFQTGLICLTTQVKLRVSDLVTYTAVTQVIAECFHKRQLLQHAVDEQRNAFRMMSDLFGPKDPRTVEGKQRLGVYLRSIGEATVKSRELAMVRRIDQVVADTKAKEAAKTNVGHPVSVPKPAGAIARTAISTQGETATSTALLNDDWLLDEDKKQAEVGGDVKKKQSKGNSKKGKK